MIKMKTEKHAVIQGTFVNYKRYPRQNCTHLLIEIPLEYTNKYVSILGEPLPGESISVAIARLHNEIPHPPVSLGVEQGGDGYNGDLQSAVPADYVDEMISGRYNPFDGG